MGRSKVERKSTSTKAKATQKPEQQPSPQKHILITSEGVFRALEEEAPEFLAHPRLPNTTLRKSSDEFRSAIQDLHPQLLDDADDLGSTRCEAAACTKGDDATTERGRRHAVLPRRVTQVTRDQADSFGSTRSTGSMRTGRRVSFMDEEGRHGSLGGDEPFYRPRTTSLPTKSILKR